MLRPELFTSQAKACGYIPFRYIPFQEGRAWRDGMNRRQFLRILGLAGGTAAVACQGKPPEKLIPALVPPDDGVLPGEAKWVPTICTECSAGAASWPGCGRGGRSNWRAIQSIPSIAAPCASAGRRASPAFTTRSESRSPSSRPGRGSPARHLGERLRDDGQRTEEAGAACAGDGSRHGTLSMLIDEFCAARSVQRLSFDPGYPAATARPTAWCSGKT